MRQASLQLDETASRTIGVSLVGALVSDDYLPGDPALTNQAWLAAVVKKYGDGAIPTASGAAMYDAVEFLGAAIKGAGDTNAAAIISASPRVTNTGPRGTVQIGAFNRGYATLAAHIGKVNKNYGIDQIEVSPPIAPTVACSPT